MRRPTTPSPNLFLSQQGATPLLLVFGVFIVVALCYVYLRQTGTVDNAASAISNGAQTLTHEAAADYHEFRAEHLAADASVTTNPIHSAAESAGAMDHKMQELEARSQADFHRDEARDQGAVVSDQVSASLADLKSAVQQKVQDVSASMHASASATTK